MKYSCILPSSRKMKNDIPTCLSGDIIFVNTSKISFLNQSAFSIFVQFSLVILVPQVVWCMFAVSDSRQAKN